MLIKESKVPSEHFTNTVDLVRSLCRPIGTDFFDPNHKITWRTTGLVLSGILYFTLIFYTIYVKFDEDWTIILGSAATMGSGVQGIFKLIDFLLKRNRIASLYMLIIRLYKEQEQLGIGHRKALQNAVIKSKKGIYLLMVLFFCGCLGMLIMPHFLYILTGERPLVIEFHFPGINIKTDNGYFTTIALQSFLVAVYTNALFCSDAAASMFLTQVYVFSNVFEAKIECLNELIENPEDNKKPEVNKALTNIIEWHQQYTEYTQLVNDIFYVIITMQVLSAFGSTLLCIYLILAGGWPGAYSYVVIAFCSLYVYCIMGTQNEIANDDFCLHMYKLNWYNLSVSHQKMTRMIIVKTQSPETIDIAGIIPLTVSTALQLTKTLYSIAMFMLEFLVD